MAQAEHAAARAFETDFWKDANLRKVWDEVVPVEPVATGEAMVEFPLVAKVG